MVFPANSGIVPPSLSNYKLKGFSYKPDSVERLLTNFQLEEKKDVLKIDLYTTNDYLDLCEYIQSSLSDFGINLDIKVNPPAIHRELVSDTSVCFFRGSWIADYPDPENYLQLFITKNKSPKGSNRTHFSNLEFDSLYEQIFVAKNNNERQKIFHKMEKIIIDSTIIVPLYYDMAVRFISKKITNFSINSMNILSLKNVKKSN